MCFDCTSRPVDVVERPYTAGTGVPTDENLLKGIWLFAPVALKVTDGGAAEALEGRGKGNLLLIGFHSKLSGGCVLLAIVCTYRNIISSA